MLKKIISILLAVAVFTAADFCCYAVSEDSVSAECAIVYCVNNGMVLFRKNEDRQRAIASTTKIMTALIACESGQLADEITATQEMVQVEGTSIGLLSGDRITIRSLVCGMLLQSGNDAANAVALALSGSCEKFAERMNARAEQIGMTQSHFANPSGLTQDGHYSTAYDMALLTAEALRNEVFSSICAQKTMAVSYGNPPYRRILTNHNKLLSVYDGVTGVKTGFTKAAGRCLVSSAERDGVVLIVVTLNAPDDWNDHVKLLDYGFSLCNAVHNDVAVEKSIPVVGGSVDRIEAVAAGDVISVSTEFAKELHYKIYMPHFVYAPLSRGDVLGTVAVFDGDRRLYEIPLVAAADVTISDKEVKNENNSSFLHRIKEFFINRRDFHG